MNNEMDDLNDAGPHLSIDHQAGYICCSCGEEIVIPIDCTQGHRQSYVEDCPVCCNPNLITVEFDAAGQPNAWSRSETG